MSIIMHYGSMNPWMTLIVAVGTLIGLYLARNPIHAAVTVLSDALSRPFRLGGRALRRAAADLRLRNKVVLVAQGKEDVGQHIEREFERVDAVLRRDLQGFPVLQRKLLDEITSIEEDYQQSREVPPLPPEWVRAVSPLLKMKPGPDRIIEGVVESLKDTVAKGQERALNEYRQAVLERHKKLSSALPFWRSVDTTLKSVDKRLAHLTERAGTLDAYMDRYEQLAKKTDEIQHMLASSGFVQFFVSLFVLAVALGGTVINFHLIALPMSEMVGGGSYIGSFRTADVAALVIILVEATMGLFFMESVRITHLFPRIGHMTERTRRRFMVAALTLLVVMAGIEAALALLREQLAVDNEALAASLASHARITALSINSWIPTAGQMVLGFILPFALAFVAIPLESFVYAARTVGGMVLVALLQLTALVLHGVGRLVRYTGMAINSLYDIVIFLPLVIEKGWLAALERQRAASPAQRGSQG
ncbi:hypothetical protein [Acidiferrobacter sp.]|uniref:hypothetical protein n=1 Tax=Acidiferrobacter sp. TaxID=1872107 RepID=UPI00260AE148|nr:hypothetical protein [Acidiferrobacter sp.]